MASSIFMNAVHCRDSTTTSTDACVAEIQGMEGPFSFPERLLQQIWARGDFDRLRARTVDGRSVAVLHPGRWNRLGGPDFRGARLKLEGVLVTGDVEVHLRAADWQAHRHAADPAYDDVVLHVVLFPTSDRFTRGGKAAEIPILSLLPLLHYDLEEYAADDAVERMANHPLARVQEELAALTEPQLRLALRTSAEARWSQKVRFARLRIERLGWTAACHQTALEILGYRFNRAPMLAVGAAHPLAAWAEDRSGELPDRAFAEQAGQWSLQGVRPANHPRSRLRQYAGWVAAAPGWPSSLASLMAADPRPGVLDLELPTRVVRREHDFGGLRRHIADAVCGNAIGGTRLDNLVCDGLLPLLAARVPERASAAAACWHHWPLGDAPERWTSLLRAFSLIGTRDWPASHGACQGLLGRLLADELRQSTGA